MVCLGWSAKADHITSKFLKAVFHKFPSSIPEYLDPYGSLGKNSNEYGCILQVGQGNE